jgi:hypothetical protein
MTDNKCPSCGAPMKLGARECGYCDYAAPAPKATEMSAEQKQHMLQLKEILNKEYGRFQWASNLFAEQRVAEQKDSAWKRKWKPRFHTHGLSTGASSLTGDSYTYFHGLRGCVYWEDGEFKQAEGIGSVFLEGGFETEYKPIWNKILAIFFGNRDKEKKAIKEGIRTQKLGKHAADFPTPEQYAAFRMNLLRQDQAFWQGGDDVLIQ